MLIDVTLTALITGVISTYAYQVGKHGAKHVLKEMFKDDVPNCQKHEQKHAKRVYDWEHDTDFKKSLERKNA